MTTQEVIDKIRALGGRASYGLKGEEGGIQIVSLEKTAIADKDLIDLQLKVFVHLAKLDVSSTMLTDKGVEAIAALGTIRFLYINHTAITNESLKAIKRLKILERLSVTHTGITDAGMGFLVSCDNLKEIDLSNTAITKAGILKICILKKLVKVRIVNTGVGQSDVEELGQRYPGIVFER
jgi:hypothetical protein